MSKLPVITSAAAGAVVRLAAEARAPPVSAHLQPRLRLIYSPAVYKINEADGLGSRRAISLSPSPAPGATGRCRAFPARSRSLSCVSRGVGTPGWQLRTMWRAVRLSQAGAGRRAQATGTGWGWGTARHLRDPLGADRPALPTAISVLLSGID